MTKEHDDLKDLDRDNLERELVRRDKQALISDALKLFDSNRMLQQIIDTRNKKVKDLEDQARGHRLELGDLRNRTWWQVLNQGLAASKSAAQRPDCASHNRRP